MNLAALLDECLVRLGDGVTYGSGCFVAPRTVLTCAHVVSGSAMVGVYWRGQRLTGHVLEAAPADGGNDPIWPYPDVAVIRVAEEVEHPCAWLGDEPYGSGGSLLGLGHSTVYASEPEPTSAAGRFGGRHGAFRRFVGDEVAPGMSGGPVLDEGSGAVCGLLKTSREVGTNLGGLVVPTAALRALSRRDEIWRAHDGYHAAHPRWTELRAVTLAARKDDLPGRSLTASEEADLLGLLSVIDMPGDLERRYAEAAAPSTRRPEHLDNYRDLVAEVAEVISPSGTAHPVLRMADRLAADLPAGPLALSLEKWVARVAGRRGEWEHLRQSRAATVKAEPSIVVQIEPGTLHPDRYLLTIWVHDDAGSTAKVYCDDRAAHTVESVRETLAAQLPPILRRLQGEATVEFVAPVALFGESFEELPALRSWTRLGRTNPVVLRDLERLHNTETWGAWRERWNQMRKAPATTWLRCGEPVDQERLDGYLRAHPEISRFVLAEGPDLAAVEVALYAGVPVLVWRRGNCPDHGDGGGCTGDRFREALDAFLAGSAGVPLPEVVRQLRALTAQDREHRCRNIVLLWDDPYRLPEPYAPLRQPPTPRGGAGPL